MARAETPEVAAKGAVAEGVVASRRTQIREVGEMVKATEAKAKAAEATATAAEATATAAAARGAATVARS